MYTKTIDDNGDNDEIEGWESELNTEETVMTTTLHCQAEKSHPFKEYSRWPSPNTMHIVIVSPCLDEVKWPAHPASVVATYE